MAKSTSVDDYLVALPDDRRGTMEGLRRTIREAAPEATESIAYDLPAFRMNGRFLVSYAAFKHHYSLFPANDAVIEALGDELAPYLAGKGTIRFATDAHSRRSRDPGRQGPAGGGRPRMTRATAAPRLDRTIRLQGGRQMAYAEWGDPAGLIPIDHWADMLAATG